MTLFCQQLQQKKSSAVNLSSLPSCLSCSIQGHDFQGLLGETCGSVCVGSIAHPQQSRGRSLTWGIDQARLSCQQQCAGCDTGLKQELRKGDSELPVAAPQHTADKSQFHLTKSLTTKQLDTRMHRVCDGSSWVALGISLFHDLYRKSTNGQKRRMFVCPLMWSQLRLLVTPASSIH